MPSNTEAYIYHVMRNTEDNHKISPSSTEVRGTYLTLKEANAAARVDLTREWSPTFFESHEIEVDEEGRVSVEAECPDGEMMSVYIEKKKAPKGLTKAATSKPKAKPQTEEPAALKGVWVIMQTDYEHHTDEEGRSHLASSVAYESLREANQAARWVLCETCGFEEENELGEMDSEEQNIGSSTKAYVGYAYVREDDRDNVKVEVTQLSVKRSAPTTQSKGSKKRKIEEVIDISSD
ncbi:hypothetical protein FB45DRAFT_351235 [Roridomyces roridus]|uniref:Uncharacterized protein n=1 Tax=Roridomyces roridus TaxID=1738132 RepID=A0AAD7C6M7_9AGAR|nr:hypothetical protein FB45DRAFT_435950 [Roridomyces roridus]KAJ7640964.1 hypothetical protein FB45DRAFT_351235 [Roridomyces roridus]